MLPSMLRRDLAQMRAQGAEPAPEDVVRLAALAARVRLSQDAARAVHLPRAAFLPRDSRWRAPLVLREPTVAHELWIEEAARWIDARDDRNFLWLHAYALSRPAAELADAFRPARAVRAVYRFAARRLCGFTREQLSAAVEYVLFGPDAPPAESPGPARGGEGGGGEAESPTLGLLVAAKAVGIGVTAEEARRMTVPELEEAVRRALLAEGRADLAAARDRALAAYCRAREEVRARATTTTTAAAPGARTDRGPTPQGGGQGR